LTPSSNQIKIQVAYQVANTIKHQGERKDKRRK